MSNVYRQQNFLLIPLFKKVELPTEEELLLREPITTYTTGFSEIFFMKNLIAIWKTSFWLL